MARTKRMEVIETEFVDEPTPKVSRTRQPRKQLRPALTIEAEEDQLKALAVDMAKEQLINRTASSQVLTHFLKLATVEKQLELEKLRSDIKVQEAKAKAYESAEEMKEMYAAALKAMRTYAGHGSSDEEEDLYDDY